MNRRSNEYRQRTPVRSNENRQRAPARERRIESSQLETDRPIELKQKQSSGPLKTNPQEPSVPVVEPQPVQKEVIVNETALANAYSDPMVNAVDDDMDIDQHSSEEQTDANDDRHSLCEKVVDEELFEDEEDGITGGDADHPIFIA